MPILSEDGEANKHRARIATIKNTRPMPSETATRLIKMYRAEFGTKPEVVVRICSASLATITMCVATGQWILLLWLGLFLVQQVLFLRVLDPHNRDNIGLRFRLALTLYVLGVAIFLSVPLYFVSHEDPMIFMPAAFALVGTAIYTLQRANPTRDVIAIDTSFFAICSFWSVFIAQTHFLHSISFYALCVLCAVVTYLFFRAQQVEQQRQQARRVAERRYAQAQKARALNQFVGGVAHDFNNQITAIMGNLELFELLDNPSERQSAMQQCRIAADRAALTVQQLVASSGRTRLQRVALDISEFLQDLNPVFTDLLEPNIDLEIRPAYHDFIADVDRDMLETCLIQLCLNAQDAMSGNGQIQIGARRVLSRPGSGLPQPEAEPPYIGIYVQDAGPGVSDETLSRLSEPFYTTKGVGAGTGLGLSAVAGFARQSGGALVLDNALPSGLHVMILLPEIKDAAD